MLLGFFFVRLTIDAHIFDTHTKRSLRDSIGMRFVCVCVFDRKAIENSNY